MKNIFTKTLIAIVFVSLLTPVLYTIAATKTVSPDQNPTKVEYTLLEPLPSLTNTSGETIKTIEFKTYVEYVFNLIIAISAVAAVFMIVFGGFQYMTTDSWQGKSDGITKVKNALLGLILVLSSYLLLKTVDPRLVSIPSTLVKPLTINYSKVENSSMSDINKQLSADIAKYSANSKQMINNNTELRNDISSLESKNTSIRSQLGSEIGASSTSVLTEQELDDYCYGDGFMDDLCTEYYDNQDIMAEKQAAVIYNTGVGILSAIQERCFGKKGKDFSDCKDTMLTVTEKYTMQLKNASQPVFASILQNYYYYSYATADMFASVNNNVGDTNASQLLASVKTVISGTGIITGATLGCLGGLITPIPGATITGCTLGGAAGYTAAKTLNDTVEKNINSSGAAQARKEIKQIYLDVIYRILSDDYLKKQIIAQTNSLLKSLGEPTTGLVTEKGNISL